MGRTARTFAPPISEALKWLDGVQFPANRPLLNLSQAAPVAPPPLPMRQAMADAVMHDPGAHLYGPDLGLPALREEIARHWSRVYDGVIGPDQVAVTSGCNQAFAAAIAAIADQGDEVILPTPWYFNHKMWLDMSGISTRALPNHADLLPRAADAARQLTDKTRAIALVSPNNPTGLEYPAELIAEFYELCQAHGLYLILDETYRDFHASPGAPHRLFSRAAWPEHFIHLYSFSKAYRLTGHRIGALIAAPSLLAEVEKFIDTVTICPSALGQRAALYGLMHLSDWVAEERRNILRVREAIQDGFDRIRGLGWRLRGLGAYFAYVEHPFDRPADDLARDLVRHASLLTLPATMFVPEDDLSGQRHLRLAFANLDLEEVDLLIGRLDALDLP